MKNKKSVIGIVGTILVLLIVISINSPINIAQEGISIEKKKDPYLKLITELNGSLETISRNNGRIRDVDENLDDHKKKLESMLKDYDTLGNEIRKNLNEVSVLSSTIDRAESDSSAIENRLKELKEEIEQNEKDYNPKQEEKFFGVGVGPLAFLLVCNLLIWVQMSSYYRRKFNR